MSRFFRTPFLALALLAAGSAGGAAEFDFAVDAPKFRVTLPGVPQMKMAPHPMREAQPHLRYLGTEGPFTVSVITPTAAAGMTALECASATVRAMAARASVPPAAQVYKARLDDHTYVAMYAAEVQGIVQLHAHFLSAAGGTHCIEVHAVRMSTSPEDLEPWFKTFEQARIAPQ